MLFAWREPDDVAWPDFLSRPVPALHASETRCHDERLSERVCVPRRPRTGFERDSRARDACGSGRLKQRIDANCSSEVVARSLVDACEPARVISIDMLLTLSGDDPFCPTFVFRSNVTRPAYGAVVLPTSQRNALGPMSSAHEWRCRWKSFKLGAKTGEHEPNTTAPEAQLPELGEFSSAFPRRMLVR